MNVALKYVTVAAGLALTVGGTTKACSQQGGAGGSGGSVGDACDYAPSRQPANPKLNGEQAGNAWDVIRVAGNKGLPERAAVIGIATTLQESQLNNSAVGDNNTAFGIFQQRPVSGWGSYREVTDPPTAASKFFSRMSKVSSWRTRRLTDVAATVQRPREDLRGEYAKHERRAGQIVNYITWKNCR